MVDRGIHYTPVVVPRRICRPRSHLLIVAVLFLPIASPVGDTYSPTQRGWTACYDTGQQNFCANYHGEIFKNARHEVFGYWLLKQESWIPINGTQLKAKTRNRNQFSEIISFKNMTPKVNFMNVWTNTGCPHGNQYQNTPTHAWEATSNDAWGRSVAVRAKKASAKIIHHLRRKNFNVQ